MVHCAGAYVYGAMIIPARILVTCGDSFHAASIARAGLAPLAALGESVFDWIDAGAGEWSLALLKRYNAILVAANLDFELELSEDGKRTVWQDYLRAGGGLLIVHSGNAGHQTTESIASLTGATFIDHPPECQVELAPLRGHPLTQGIPAPFTIFDEQYRMSFNETDTDVFLISRTLHGEQPAGWTRVVGNGRVCVLTPGHHLDVWLHPSFQNLLHNALNWVRLKKSSSG